MNIITLFYVGIMKFEKLGGKVSESFFTLSGIKASPHKSHLMFRGVRRLVGILRMNSFETTTKKKYFQFDNDYFLEFSSFSV
jgi:hypothetical protein